MARCAGASASLGCCLRRAPSASRLLAATCFGCCSVQPLGTLPNTQQHQPSPHSQQQPTQRDLPSAPQPPQPPRPHSTADLCTTLHGQWGRNDAHRCGRQAGRGERRDDAPLCCPRDLRAHRSARLLAASLLLLLSSIVRQSHPMYTAAQNEGTRGFSAQAGAVPVAAGHDTAAAIDEAAATISAATTTDPASVTVTAPSTPTTPTSTSSYPRRRSSSAASSPSSDPQLQSTASSSSALPAGTKFALTKNFIDKWRHKKPPFGYNGLGELVYRRTYSRKKNEVAAGGEGANEQWFETVERVVNGTYNMQKAWIEQHDLGWNAWKAQKSAQEMFERIFSMKFLPPGRGLWAMGSPITETRGLFAALNNCLTMDQQILTSEGFLFHEEFAARAAAGKLVEVACFHEKSQSLTYESIGASDVLIKAIDSAAHPKDPSHQIVDFACDDDKHGNNAALSCTADHDAYLRFSVASNLDHGQKDYRKMHAGEVLKAEHQKEAHEARVLTLAANGMAPRKDPPPVFAELGLVTEDQRSAFCELYGECRYTE